MGNDKECHSAIDPVHHDDLQQQSLFDVRVGGVLLCRSISDDDFQCSPVVCVSERASKRSKYFMLCRHHRWISFRCRSRVTHRHFLINRHHLWHHRVVLALDVFDLHEEDVAICQRGSLAIELLQQHLLVLFVPPAHHHKRRTKKRDKLRVHWRTLVLGCNDYRGRLRISYWLRNHTSNQSDFSAHAQHFWNGKSVRANRAGNFLVSRSQILPLVDVERCSFTWKLRICKSEAAGDGQETSTRSKYTKTLNSDQIFIFPRIYFKYFFCNFLCSVK